MPSAVSDSSTLIHLAGIGRIALLHELFDLITVPTAVWREVVVEGRGRPGTAELKAAFDAGWLEIATPANEHLVSLLRRDLDEGESQVIALALERGSAMVLLDETDGREIAKRYSLPITGTIGILMRARLTGKIKSLRDELNKLREETGFWFNDALYQEALRAVGES